MPSSVCRNPKQKAHGEKKRQRKATEGTKPQTEPERAGGTDIETGTRNGFPAPRGFVLFHVQACAEAEVTVRGNGIDGGALNGSLNRTQQNWRQMGMNSPHGKHNRTISTQKRPMLMCLVRALSRLNCTILLQSLLDKVVWV